MNIVETLGLLSITPGSKGAELQSAEEVFLSFLEKSSEDVLREQTLERLNLTEEGIRRLKPEDRAEVEERIIALIREETEEELRKDEGFIEGFEKYEKFEKSEG